MRQQLLWTLPLLVLISLPLKAATYRGTVVAIHDGDTIQVDIGEGKPARVRLQGTDSPEVFVNNQSQGDVAYAARDHLIEMLPIGSEVTFKTSGTETDKHQRYLGQVFYNNKDINAEMLRMGWSAFYIIAPYEKTMVRDYSVAAKEGFESRRGMFSSTYAGTMMPYQFRMMVMNQKPRNLLGNLENRKLYRQDDMEQVPVYARVFFSSLEAAKARGFDY